MISWVAMDRIVERKRAADAAYRKQGADKVLRSDAKRLTDGELLAKLSSFGIALDRPSLERLCDQALSAEEIAQPLLNQRTFHGRQQQMESDWIWVCLSALWQRWFPDKPSFEALDDKMQAGYELRSSGVVAVCRVWLEALSDVLRILDKAGMRSIQEFDERFRGSQSLRTHPAGRASIADVRDRADIADRLADACEEQGRDEEVCLRRPRAHPSAPGKLNLEKNYPPRGQQSRQITQRRGNHSQIASS